MIHNCVALHKITPNYWDVTIIFVRSKKRASILKIIGLTEFYDKKMELRRERGAELEWL